MLDAFSLKKNAAYCSMSPTLTNFTFYNPSGKKSASICIYCNTPEGVLISDRVHPFSKYSLSFKLNANTLSLHEGRNHSSYTNCSLSKVVPVSLSGKDAQRGILTITL